MNTFLNIKKAIKLRKRNYLFRKTITITFQTVLKYKRELLIKTYQVSEKV